MQIMEGDLARTLKRTFIRIAHIQLADNPGRNEPGTGEINYPFLYGHLDRIGYGGWVGAEYKPKGWNSRWPGVVSGCGEKGKCGGVTLADCRAWGRAATAAEGMGRKG